MQVNISTEQALSELEKRLKSYLDPIPSGQLSTFRVEIKAAGHSLVSFTNKCNASIDACGNLLKKIEHGIQVFEHVGNQLQDRITRNTAATKDVFAKLERDSKQRILIWIMLSIILFVALAFVWTLGAMHQSALDRSKFRPTEEQTDR